MICTVMEAARGHTVPAAHAAASFVFCMYCQPHDCWFIAFLLKHLLYHAVKSHMASKVCTLVYPCLLFGGNQAVFQVEIWVRTTPISGLVRFGNGEVW
jgi:hypothetical protein